MSDTEILPGGAEPPPPNTWHPRLRTLNTGDTVAPGAPLYATENGGVDQAIATGNEYLPQCIGLNLHVAIDGERTFARYAGLVVLTDIEWRFIEEDGNALVPGQVYFISVDSAGKLTPSEPVTGYSAPIGIAVSETTMLVQISDVKFLS